jgi:hypothetical protein
MIDQPVKKTINQPINVLVMCVKPPNFHLIFIFILRLVLTSGCIDSVVALAGFIFVQALNGEVADQRRLLSLGKLNVLFDDRGSFSPSLHPATHQLLTSESKVIFSCLFHSKHESTTADKGPQRVAGDP